MYLILPPELSVLVLNHVLNLRLEVEVEFLEGVGRSTGAIAWKRLSYRHGHDGRQVSGNVLVARGNSNQLSSH